MNCSKILTPRDIRCGSSMGFALWKEGRR